MRKYTKLIGSTPNGDSRLDAEIVVPLKYSNNFWRYLDLSLTNCEIELDLSWSRYWVISELSRTSRTVRNSPTQEKATRTNRGTLQINNVGHYVPVVTLTIDNIKFLKNANQGFKRTTSCKKHSPEIITQSKKDNSYYLDDPPFRNIKRLSVLLFKNGNNDPTKNLFHKKLHAISRNQIFSLTAQNLKLFGWKLQHFSNDAFQSYYDPFQVNWLVQNSWYLYKS